jgi:U6 snRNA phosphodiesterase
VNSDSICIHPAQSESSSAPTVTENSAEAFPTISRLPPELITSLIEHYSARLSSSHTGNFDVEKVVVKIGKETTSWRLLGM